MSNAIINCDDFGLSSSINQGVEEAYKMGMMSSASLLVHSSATDHAVKIAERHPELDIGLHLNLDTIFGFGANCFYGSSLSNNDEELYKASFKKMDLIESMIEDQFKKFFSFNIPLSHVDGHHHVHLLPGVFQKVVRISKKYGVRNIRFFQEFYENQGFIYQSFLSTLKRNGFSYPDGFKNLSSQDCFKSFNENVTEVMVHIESPSANGDNWRVKQFNHLTSKEFRLSLEEKGVCVIPYRVFSEKND